MIVHKSRKKAVCITVAGFLAGIAGGLILRKQLMDDIVREQNVAG